MSLRPTRSGGSPARIAAASWLVSSFGDVRWSTIFRLGCVALNSFTNPFGTASVASLAQNWTVPVALTPNAGAAADFVFDAAEIPVMVSSPVAMTATTADFKYFRLIANLPLAEWNDNYCLLRYSHPSKRFAKRFDGNSPDLPSQDGDGQETSSVSKQNRSR